jgi:hypothetical protein
MFREFSNEIVSIKFPDSISVSWRPRGDWPSRSTSISVVMGATLKSTYVNLPQGLIHFNLHNRIHPSVHILQYKHNHPSVQNNPHSHVYRFILPI